MAQDEAENAMTGRTIEGAPGGDPSDMGLEAIELLRLHEELARIAELEAATSPVAMEPEAPSSSETKDQGDRIELLGQKALGGIREIADYLNPVHRAAGETPRPEPLVALLRSSSLICRELWSQGNRLKALEEAAVQQAEALATLASEMSFLVNALRSDEAET